MDDSAKTLANAPHGLIAQRYRIECLISSGSWSNVYLARDEKNHNAPYAIKVLKPRMLEDEDIVNRFYKEVQLTQQLQHANIVQVYSSGFTTEGLPYLVADYVPGVDLERYLASRGTRVTPYLRALNILRFIARGLGHAHERKVLHRDVKPANILITPSNNIKIADFGIGASLRFSSANLSDEILGTPYYMAPEQFSGDNVGPWSDVYSIGILAYELFTGKKPFDAQHFSHIMHQHCYIAAPTLLFKGGSIPCWVEDLVHKACEKDSAQRFANGNELAQALEKGLELENAQSPKWKQYFYLIRPSGKLCTLLTERGVPRKKINYSLFAITGLLLALLTTFFLMRFF